MGKWYRQHKFRPGRGRGGLCGGRPLEPSGLRTRPPMPWCPLPHPFHSTCPAPRAVSLGLQCFLCHTFCSASLRPAQALFGLAPSKSPLPVSRPPFTCCWLAALPSCLFSIACALSSLLASKRSTLPAPSLSLSPLALSSRVGAPCCTIKSKWYRCSAWHPPALPYLLHLLQRDPILPAVLS